MFAYCACACGWVFAWVGVTMSGCEVARAHVIVVVCQCNVIYWNVPDYILFYELREPLCVYCARTCMYVCVCVFNFVDQPHLPTQLHTHAQKGAPAENAKTKTL